MASKQKRLGAYYSPEIVARTLVRWAIREGSNRLLDPSCGDGCFLALHTRSVGIEQDADAFQEALARAPQAAVHNCDFFTWASQTKERFDIVAGNPPFIRYQTFTGEIRRRAQELCAGLGANFSGLSSSWAPFLVVAASLLNPGGRLAFIVPAEIGHAPYARPLLDYLLSNFASVHVVAIREKLFPDLSEDCWLLTADGHSGSAEFLGFTAVDRFNPSVLAYPPAQHISVRDWRANWKGRLRPYLLSQEARDLYLDQARAPSSRRLGDIASVGIGYVSGANDFFHLRPSTADKFGIPSNFLRATVRKGSDLPPRALTTATVDKWIEEDRAALVLTLPKGLELPSQIRCYLATDAGLRAREAYKCRTRDPWWAVPDVRTPDMFLTYMSGLAPSLVRNAAGCTATNSVHYVQLHGFGSNPQELSRAFESSFVRLSCEIEGHPLGGGMLKLEPREATEIVIPAVCPRTSVIEEALDRLRAWRHCAVGMRGPDLLVQALATQDG